MRGLRKGVVWLRPEAALLPSVVKREFPHAADNDPVSNIVGADSLFILGVHFVEESGLFDQLRRSGASEQRISMREALFEARLKGVITDS